MVYLEKEIVSFDSLFEKLQGGTKEINVEMGKTWMSPCLYYVRIQRKNLYC